MTPLIFGRASNLSRQLAMAWPGALAWSVRDVVEGRFPDLARETPLLVVLNHFQPAVALGDTSDPQGYVARAIGATASILDWLAERRVEKLIYTSSAAVYGDSKECREADRPRAAGLHAGLKVANEDLVLKVAQRQGWSASIARLFNLYGGDDHFSVVSKIVAAAREAQTFGLVNGGHAIRDFIHIRDVVRCYGALARSDLEIVNVASGVGVSVRSLVDALAIRGVCLSTTNRPRQEIRMSIADVTRLRQIVDPDGFVSVEGWVVEQVLT
ncbi:MAG: NAD(P)-dependent oxidoreductase [Myxococcota bacterium]